MNLSKKLELAHGHADHMLVMAYDYSSEFPITAESHTDFWPGEAARWVQGYIASEATTQMGLTLAQGVMNAVGKSVRDNGAIPHYMLGSHRRFGGRIETNIIDRTVQRFSGNGMKRSAAGNWVTTINAAPTAGIAALALSRAGIGLPGTISLKTILRAHNEITQTARSKEGLIEAHNPNELTNNSGALAKRLKSDGRVVDPAVNALYINNSRAIAELWNSDDFSQLFLEGDAKNAQAGVEKLLEREHDKGDGLSLESTLAAARLGLTGMIRESDLLHLFRAPNADDKHPEQTRSSLPDAIEAARLTAGSFEVSRIFLGRIVGKIAENNHMLTRYESISPGDNVIANRAYRRQLWAPTAAEVRQITLSMID